MGDGGDLSHQRTGSGSPRPLSSPPTRNNMRALASQFPLACLPLRQRVEELFAFLKGDCGAVHPTHRAAHALPIHLLCCFLAYSLSQSLTTSLISPGIAL